MTARVRRLLIVMAIGWLPVLIARDTVPAAAALTDLATSSNPYFVPSHAALLYLWAPLVVASACLLLLSPGLLLASALHAADTIGQWMLSGLTLSLIVVSTAVAAVQALSAQPIRGGAFAAVVVACAVVSAGVLVYQSRRGRLRAWPLDHPGARLTILSYIAAPALLLIALAPKFYWESFNGDGAHAFESARLLLVKPLPFWDPSAGNVAAFPGLTSMLYAFPTSWFIRLFGELEVSARLPLLLYVAAIHGAIVALVEQGRATSVRFVEQWLLWLQLAVYTVVVAFSTTYSPYAADLALPATQDTLTVLCFLGCVLSFVQAARAWMVLFTVLTFISLPNGLLLIVFWLCAVWLIWRPPPTGTLRLTIIALTGCVVASVLAPTLFRALGIATPGGEYGAAGLLGRFAFLQLTDWRRIAYVAVPCGIAPALALLAWPQQDRVARALTLVSVAYFAMFYVQAFVALHHFIPAMLLPLVVFWRNPMVSHRLVLAGSGVAAVLALMLSLPDRAIIDMSGRQVGSTITDRFQGYDRSDPRVFERAALLQELFPPAWDARVPEHTYGGSELVWNYYSHRGAGEPNYIMQPAGDAAPEPASLIATRGDAALYVRSEATWAAQRSLRPATFAGSALYAIPRTMLFRTRNPPPGSGVISVPAVLSRLGLPVDALIERLSIRPQNK